VAWGGDNPTLILPPHTPQLGMTKGFDASRLMKFAKAQPTPALAPDDRHLER
jgi:hypothetical protein